MMFNGCHSPDAAVEMLSLVDDDGQLPFVSALFDVNQDIDEMQKIVGILTHTFDSQNLLSLLIFKELHRQLSSHSVGIVLRGTNPASALLSYSFQTFGSDFLTHAIDPIADLVENDLLAYEVNPANTLPDADLARNRQNLMKLTDSILTSLINNRQRIPSKLRYLMRGVHQILLEKESEKDAIRLTGVMLIFLRFINPFLTSDFDNEKVQRAFTLVAKLFQAAANGQKLREKHMLCMNEYIEQLKDRIYEFVNYLLTMEDSEVTQSSISSREYLEEVGYHILHSKLSCDKEKLMQNLKNKKTVNRKALRRLEKMLLALDDVKQ